MASQVSNSGSVQDEAQEKLFSDNNISNEPKIEIKFLDSKNGDTKIDISEVRQVFVGMGKEELMKFANDPFWVKLRWLLFILFWFLWVAMLSGAVAIILLAPKCDSTVLDEQQSNTVYSVNVKDFIDSNGDGKGDIIGLESKLDYFKTIGVETILLDPLMETDPGTDDVIDFQELNPAYGTTADLKKLIATAKSKSLKLLMSIVPNFSSIKHKWFKYSAAKKEPYTNYYVWSDPDPTYTDDSTTNPPNNWLSVYGGSAWEWNEERKQYYLHQFNVSQPDLNFTNPDVINYFKDVFKFWLDLGLSGIHLDKVEYLIEDKNFLNENPSSFTETFLTDYKFLIHTRTRYQSETMDVLSEWADTFKNYSAILSISGIQDGVSFEKGDLIFRPIRVEKSLTAGDLYEALRSRLNKTSQTWGVVCDLQEGCNENIVIGLQAVLLMLPGTTVIRSGLELGLPLSNIFQWNSTAKYQGFSSIEPWKPLDTNYSSRNFATEETDPSSFYNAFRKLIEIRKIEPSIIHGATNIGVLNGSVLVFTRFKDGNPQYLVAFNLEDSDKVVNLQESFNKGVPSKLTIASCSSHFDYKTSTELKDKIKSMKMPGYSFIVLQYVL